MWYCITPHSSEGTFRNIEAENKYWIIYHHKKIDSFWIISFGFINFQTGSFIRIQIHPFPSILNEFIHMKCFSSYLWIDSFKHLHLNGSMQSVFLVITLWLTSADKFKHLGANSGSSFRWNTIHKKRAANSNNLIPRLL